MCVREKRIEGGGDKNVREVVKECGDYITVFKINFKFVSSTWLRLRLNFYLIERVCYCMCETAERIVFVDRDSGCVCVCLLYFFFLLISLERPDERERENIGQPLQRGVRRVREVVK